MASGGRAHREARAPSARAGSGAGSARLAAAAEGPAATGRLPRQGNFTKPGEGG